MSIQLEHIVLDYLYKNDNGNFIDITYIDENYMALNETLNELKGKNLILIDDQSARDFEAFGITNTRKKSIHAKIKMNGKIYLHSLKKINQLTENSEKRKRSWKFAYLFNF
jgi:hypothetical protein